MHPTVHRPFPEPPAHQGPFSSLSQAYDVIPPRHLAPTVGPAVALAGVFIRTGNFLNTGERVLSGLMQRIDSHYLVFDTAGCFSQGPMPAIGNHFTFGTFDVYVAIAQPFVYPQVVHVAEDPPCHLAARGRRTARPVSCEVMMATLGPATEADATAAETEAEVPWRAS